jgi:hypothetical protein
MFGLVILLVLMGQSLGILLTVDEVFEYRG